jgi:hypothetical protein
MEGGDWNAFSFTAGSSAKGGDKVNKHMKASMHGLIYFIFARKLLSACSAEYGRRLREADCTCIVPIEHWKLGPEEMTAQKTGLFERQSSATCNHEKSY